MIRIHLKHFVINGDFFYTSNKQEITIMVQGHAEWAAKGSDIVCSAVSAIVQTAIIGITKVAKIRQNIRQSEGFLESTISINQAKSENLNDLKVILKTMIFGIEEIAINYPNRVEIIYE